MERLWNASKATGQQKQEPQLPGLQELAGKIARFYEAGDADGIRRMYLKWMALNQRLSPKMRHSDASPMAYSLFEGLCVSTDYFLMTGDVMPYYILNRIIGDDDWAV